MSLKTILSKHGTVVSLDWRPGDPIQVKHPSDVPTADILVLEALGNPTRIIYADKAFGRCVEKLAYGLELWDYAETLAMPVDTALAYLKKKSMSYALVFSCYERRVKINPKNLLDAATQNNASLLGKVILPHPAYALSLLSDDGVWTSEGEKWRCQHWEKVSILLHNPKIVDMQKGVIVLAPSFLGEAVVRLARVYLKRVCSVSAVMLKRRQEWPSRSIKNLVLAKKRRVEQKKELRKMPPCVRAALCSKQPLTYQLRFQLAEVFSHSTIEMLNTELEKREEIDGKHRQSNVRACYHVARKKRADQRPCVTRGKANGLYCVFGGGTSGVQECARQQGFTGNPETVTISQMWGLH